MLPSKVVFTSDGASLDKDKNSRERSSPEKNYPQKESDSPRIRIRIHKGFSLPKGRLINDRIRDFRSSGQ